MADRAVLVEGALNVRDLGGLTTTDGRPVRTRRVLRADSLSRLEEPGVATLVDDIGVRLIIDLRVEQEIGLEGRGALEAHPVRYVNLPLRATERVRENVAPDISDLDLAVVYGGYLENSAQSLVAAIALLADAENMPAVVHCTVGKDRTGIVVAMLLDTLGVEHDQIVADYAATAHNMERVLDRLSRSELFREIGLDRLPPQILSAEPDTMRRFLDTMTARYGGAAQWLVEHGLDPGLTERLREQILDV